MISPSQKGDTPRVDHLAAARSGDKAAFGALVEPHRRELLTHCYRMLGSFQDAEDQVQETLLRAWRRLDTYEGRASFRAWLYKIATNACLDALKKRSRRALPPDLRAASDPGEPILPPVTDPIWLEPFPDDLLALSAANPEARYEAHESITLAFMTALQRLPPRQRSVLLFCDVLDWPAPEVASLLETTVPAINSVLYRARSSLSKNYTAQNYRDYRLAREKERTGELLRRYVQAWESADIDALVALLKEDATFPMPPLPLWYKGRSAIRAFVSAVILSGEARGRWALHPLKANGQPAYAWYRRDDSSGRYQAYAIQVLTIQDEFFSDVTTFGYPQLFPHFGLALEL